MRNVKGKFQSSIVGGKKVKKKRLRGSSFHWFFLLLGDESLTSRKKTFSLNVLVVA